MELVQAYIEKHNSIKDEPELTPVKPTIDIGELVQYLKTDIAVMLRKNSSYRLSSSDQ